MSSDNSSFETDEIIEIERIFSLFTTESKPQIPLKDIPNVFKGVGLHRTESEMSKLLSPFEGLKGLDFPQFLSLLTQDSTLSNNPKNYVRTMSVFTEQAKEAFISMDTNGDGTISPDELKEGVHKMLGQEAEQIDIDAMFSAADSNKDGEIDFSEFRNALKKAST